MEIHRVKAIKQLVLYIRFIESAAQQISEANGRYEILPPASQTALLNVAFASKYIGIPDLKNFGDRIKQYFELSNLFNHKFNTWEGVDPELKKHCQIIKMQRVAPKELAQYYSEYMKRHALQPDPRVTNKLDTGSYSDSLDDGAGGLTTNTFISPAEEQRLEMERLRAQQQGGMGGPGNNNNLGGQGGYGGQQGPGGAGFGGQGYGGNPNNGFGQGGYGAGGAGGFNNNGFQNNNNNGNRFGGNNGFGNNGGMGAGGAWGFNNGGQGGYGGGAGGNRNFNNNQFQQHQQQGGFGANPNQGFGNNQFTQPGGFNNNQNQGFNNQNRGFNNNQNQGFNPNPNQGFNNNQFSSNTPSFGNQNQFTKPATQNQGGYSNNNNQINASNPFAPQNNLGGGQNNLGGGGAGAGGLGHDDIFGSKAPGSNNQAAPLFGGPAGEPQKTGDPQFDNFVQQLDDLRKI